LVTLAVILSTVENYFDILRAVSDYYEDLTSIVYKSLNTENFINVEEECFMVV